MDDRTEPNNCTGTNWYTVVRDFGTILFGSVRDFGMKFWYDIIWLSTWYETQWFGSGSDSWFVVSGPVRNGSVRIFQKIVFFSNRNVYESTYLVRNRFGRKISFLKNTNRTIS